MDSHPYQICRAIYGAARQNNNAPSVAILDLGGGCWAGETTDGLVLNENLTGYCCKWAAKFDVVLEWVELKENNLATDKDE